MATSLLRPLILRNEKLQGTACDKHCQRRIYKRSIRTFGVFIVCGALQFLVQGRIQKIQKEGTKSPPHPLSPRMKTSGHAAYSIAGVFVMQSKVMLTFQNIELKSILCTSQIEASTSPPGTHGWGI